ncbi:MAG: YcxB family protein [Terracidiphilus sp.]
MKLEYSITLADYQAAQALHWRQTPVRRVLNFLIYDGIPCLGAAMGCVLMKRFGVLGHGRSYWFELLFGLLVGSAYLLTTAKGRNRKKFRKHFERRFPPHKRRAWIEFNEVGITSAVIGTEPESHAWNSIIGFAQDQEMILFYLAKSRFLIFPLSGMSRTQRTELNGLVARHLPKRNP